jgi:hypothetical protein
MYVCIYIFVSIHRMCEFESVWYETCVLNLYHSPPALGSLHLFFHYLHTNVININSPILEIKK